jgi:hypothetical protein
MTIALTTFEAQLNSLIPDNSAELEAADRYRAVRQACAMYSLDFPVEVALDVTGDAGKFYAIATALTSWSEGHSRIVRIEYPAATVASDESPTYLEPEDWDDAYWYSSTRYLYLPNHAPAATETMRITYTAPYSWVAGATATSVTQASHGFAVNDLIYLVSATWTAATDPYLGTHIVITVPTSGTFTCKNLAIDVPQAHFWAVCDLAACVACRTIAAKYAFIGDSLVNVDSAAHINKSQTFAERANDLCARYRAAMGLAEPNADRPAEPAGEFVDFDTAPGWPMGRQFIFRNKAVR